MRNYLVDYSRYSFIAEEDWGDYDNGEYRNGYFDKNGYCLHSYLCNDGKFHTILEHIAKWEYFNGEIPEDLQIDHIIPIKNGGTNKLSNLRCVTHKENMNNEITLTKTKENAQDINRNKKISSALKGKNKTKEHAENIAKGHWLKVYQYTLDGVLVKIWDSALDAAKNGFHYPSIIRCCTGKRKTHKGYRWSHEPL